ncbi:MAG: hypothetical protein ACK52I_12870 [Pseudomonadota bacterium]|jgi:hypothetical protein
MTKNYIVTAGNTSTDLGVVGSSSTLLGAKRIGRRAVRESLPNGEGSYRVQEWVIDETGVTVTVSGAERSIRTGFQWAES